MSATLRLFKKSLQGDLLPFDIQNVLPFEEVNKISLPLGYLITKEACTPETIAWLETQYIDYSSTFYKNWTTIVNKTREEIWVDQIISYIGVFCAGQDWRPQDVDSVIPEITKYQVIDVISKEDAITKCDNMLNSGVAFSLDTIKDILEVYKTLNITPKIHNVKNKEAKMLLYKATDTIPTNSEECLRYIVFCITGKTLLIKDKATIKAIKANNAIFDLWSIVDKIGFTKMAAIYHRYNKLFLAFKGLNKRNNQCVNKLSKLADKYHAPMVAGYWQTVLNNPFAIKTIDIEVEKLDNFSKVKLLQAITIRLYNTDISVYRVRNGKLWLKENTKLTIRNQYNYIFGVIKKSLIDSLGKKATTFFIPKGVSIALPTSEKNFVGDYPTGSSITLSDNDTVIGVNRLPEHAAGYMDFSLTDDKGEKIGWDKAYFDKNKDVIFSGDVSIPNRDKQATELFYAKKGFKGRYLLKLNDFSNNGEIPFKFFVATEQIANLEKNHMVDPNNIVFKTDMKLEGKELCLGAVNCDKLIFVKLITGSARVSGKDATIPLANYIFSTAESYLDMKRILIDAGFTFTSENPKLDFSNISKGMVLDLLS